MKVFIQKAMQWGAKLVPSKGKHLKFRDSLGHQISAPKTSSDWRSIKNFESELRRRGFVNQNTATKVKDALSSKPKVKEIKLSSQQRRLSASANRKAGGLSLQNFMRKVEGKDLIQPAPTSRTTIKSLPASKLGKQKPKAPTLTQRKLKPSRTGSNPSERMTKAFDDRLDALIQSVRNSPRRRVNRLEKSSTTTAPRTGSTSTRTTPKGERKKISRAELDGMNIPQKQKDELIKQGLVTENKFRAAAQLMRKAGVRNYDDLVRTVSELKNKAAGIKKPLKPGVRRQLMKKVQEQMVVPRSIKKKNPLMTVKTEMEILKQLSNRKAAYDAARTGKAMYPFSEDNKHREDKLNYQYKEVTNPKKPVDVIKALKLKKA